MRRATARWWRWPLRDFVRRALAALAFAEARPFG